MLSPFRKYHKHGFGVALMNTGNATLADQPMHLTLPSLKTMLVKSSVGSDEHRTYEPHHLHSEQCNKAIMLCQTHFLLANMT